MKTEIRIELEYLMELLLDGYKEVYSPPPSVLDRFLKQNEDLMNQLALLDPEEKLYHIEKIDSDQKERSILWRIKDWKQSQEWNRRRKEDSDKRIAEHEDDKQFLEDMEAELGISKDHPAFKIMAQKFIKHKDKLKKIL
jgi:hypothetical protein